MPGTSGWSDLVELTSAQSSVNTQLLVHDGDEAGDPKEKYMTRAEARIMILQAMQYFAALTPAADKLPYFDGTTSAALADLSASGRAMIAAASAAAQLALLGGAPLDSPALIGTPTTTTAAGSDNSTRVASTAQVQAAIALAVTGVLELKGNTDASTNPNYPSGVVGDLYYVSVAGKIGGASGKSVDVSDAIVCKTDNAGGTEASVGTSWFVLEHNLAGAMLAANNLSDVASASTARTNLGLGTIATEAAADFAPCAQATLTAGASVALDFAAAGLKTLTTDQNTTFTTSNRAAGRQPYNLRLIGGGAHSLTFPAGWKWLNNTMPAAIASGKTGRLCLECYGTADTDVVASFAVEA